MVPNMRLLPNGDGTYDLVLDFPRSQAELAEEFYQGKNRKTNSGELKKRILEQAKRAKIKSVKILVSGALVATIAFSSLLTAFAQTDRYTMGYLYGGTDIQQVEYVNQAGDALDTVSPSYFDIREDGSLKLNYLSPYFIKSMHDRGMKVVPFLSNHWNRAAGIRALENVDSLSTQLADYIEEYDLDGINVDIENVTHEQRDQYTELVRLLREKIPREKEVSVAVAANPNNWQTGWHGSYDYTALAQYADHLVVMAYDEHYEGGEAGPVASIDFVEKSIQYALDKTSPDKIVVGIPFYGRVWSLDDNRIVGKGASSKTIQEIIEDCDATVEYDEATQSVQAQFTVTPSDGNYTVGGDFVLKPGNYVAWFENSRSYEEKLGLVEKYNLKGAGAWSLGQEDTSIWEHYEDWVNGDADSGQDSTVQPPSDPQQPVLPEQPEPDSNPQSPSQEYRIHRVQSGDTLWKISQQYLGQGSRYREVMQLNGLADDRIYPGMELKIPGTQGQGSTPPKPEAAYRNYTVKRGDTLWKISQQYLGQGSRYREIIQLNGLASDIIHPGQVLKLPK